MKYALRNLIRIPRRTVTMLLVLVTVLMLVMWSVLIATMCTAAIESYGGALANSIRMTDGNSRLPEGEVPVNMNLAEALEESYDIVTDLAAYVIDSVDLPGTAYIEGDKNNDKKNADWRTHKTYYCTDMSVTPDVVSGRVQVIEGEPIVQADYDTAAHKIVISEDIAKKNGYAVGDVIRVYLYYKRAGAPNETVQPLTVCGIYRVNDVMTGLPEFSYQITENDVYIPMSTYWTLLGLKRGQITPDEAYFYMEDPDAETVARLEKSMQEKTVPLLALELIEPDRVTQGISKLLMLARAAAVLLTVCGLIAFLVMLFLNLGSRTRELGILTALGKPSGKTANVFLCEVAVIALCALLVATTFFALSAGVGVGFINSFLSSDAVLTEQTNTTMRSVMNKMIEEANKPDVLPSLLTSFGIATAATGLVIVLSSSLIRIYLKKFNLLRILSGGTE